MGLISFVVGAALAAVTIARGPDPSDATPAFLSINAQMERMIRWSNDEGVAVSLAGGGAWGLGGIGLVRRCRERGVCPWVSLRMNDVHHQDKDEHPIHSDFWRAHPELRRRGYEGHFAKALDYAHEAVRNHYLALATETLERYDMDGLELDFMREPYLFSKGEEEAGREILTDWLRTVRALVDRHAAARGHAIRLGVRVPSRPETAALFGLDAVWWSQEGIVDLLVVTPRWASTEFDMPVRDWRRLLEGSSTTLAGGLEVLVRPFRDGPAHGATPAEALGAAAQVLHDGADSVYLFNYFPSGQPAGGARHWSAEEYAATLRAMTSLDSIVQHPRRHVITFSDVGTPAGDEGRASQLPAEGTDLAFQLPTGPAPGAGWKAELRVDVGREGAAAAAPPTASVNGSAATQKERCGEADGPCTHVYEVPVDALRASGGNRIDVHGVDGLPIKGVGVSIGLCAGD